MFNQLEFAYIGFAAQPGSEKRVQTAWRWRWQDSDFHGFQKTGTFSRAISSFASSQGLPRGLERRRLKRKAVLSPPTEPEVQTRRPKQGAVVLLPGELVDYPDLQGRRPGASSGGTGMFQTPIPSPFVEGTSTPCQALGPCRAISFSQPSHFTKPAGVKRGKCLRAS